MIEVFDDSPPLPSQNLGKRRASGVVQLGGSEVIEISDSEGDIPDFFVNEPLAGPSHSQFDDGVPLPLFLPDFDDEFFVGASQHNPLFIGSPEQPRGASAELEAPVLPDPLNNADHPDEENPTTPEEEESDPPLDRYLAQIVDIVPDVEPGHVLDLLSSHYPDYKDQVVENILHKLFEDPKYPKIEKGKGKRKRDAEDEDDGERWAGGRSMGTSNDFDYGSTNRIAKGGRHYDDLAQVCHFGLS